MVDIEWFTKRELRRWNVATEQRNNEREIGAFVIKRAARDLAVPPSFHRSVSSARMAFPETTAQQHKARPLHDLRRAQMRRLACHSVRHQLTPEVNNASPASSTRRRDWRRATRRTARLSRP